MIKSIGIVLLVCSSFVGLKGQFLEFVSLSRGLSMTWGGVTQLEILDTGIYVGCHTTKRFYPIDGDKTVANYFDFAGNDLGYKIFPNQPWALGGGLQFLPGYGFTRSNVFKIPFNDSLVLDFYDLQGNLKWSRSGMERSGISIVGVTSDSFAIGSTASYYTPNPGIVKLDLRQGDLFLLTYAQILDSLNAIYPGGNFMNLFLTEGGILDSTGLAHFILTTRDSLYNPTHLIHFSINADFEVVFTDTVALPPVITQKINPYFLFDEDYIYQIKENYDSLNKKSFFIIDVFADPATHVQQFSFSQKNVPQQFLAWPKVNYHNNHLAIASREIITVPDPYDSSRFDVGYYSRFMVLDTNNTFLYDKSLRLDTNKLSRFVPEHILLDDSLNLYFIASYNDRLQWYLGKITANGGIVNPLSDFSVQAKQEDGFTLYPNPFSDELQIETTTRGEYHLKLFNLTSKLILETQFKENEQAKLNTEMLEPGLYIYQVQNVESGEIQRGKILKR